MAAALRYATIVYSATPKTPCAVRARLNHFQRGVCTCATYYCLRSGFAPDGNRRRGAGPRLSIVSLRLAGQPSKRLLPCGAFAVAKGQSLSVAAQCPQSFMLSRGAARWGFLTPGRCARHQLLGSPVPCLKALARGGKRRILWLAQAMTPLEPLATLACPLALPLLPLQPRILATRVAGPPTPPLPPPPPLACFY